MKLGFVSVPSEAQIKLASEAGFDGIEVALGRWMGPDFDMTLESGKKAKDLLDRYGMKGLTVHFGENYAESPDPDRKSVV